MSVASSRTYIVTQSLPELHHCNNSVVVVRLLGKIPYFVVTVCLRALFGRRVGFCGLAATVAMQAESAERIFQSVPTHMWCVHVTCSRSRCNCLQWAKRSELKPPHNHLLERWAVGIAARVPSNLRSISTRSKTKQFSAPLCSKHTNERARDGAPCAHQWSTEPRLTLTRLGPP